MIRTPKIPPMINPILCGCKLGDALRLLFLPRELEGMIVRSIPFIIAGLAVALGFKAGLFNIGAEGQLYAGAIIAVYVGYSTLFVGLPVIYPHFAGGCSSGLSAACCGGQSPAH